ncbi:MAG: peptidylprolyl isomerase [Ferruginibacter sp.]
MIKKNNLKKAALAVVIMLSCMGSAAQKKQEVVQIKTTYGEILVWLYNETPQHKKSFLQMARAGYWDSLSFNRVIPNFVAQGGCPDTPEGFKDSTMLLAPEFDSSLTHEYGAFGAGRDDNAAMMSARCQFYIVQNKKGLHRLDNKYTVFGKVIKGMDVVDTIVQLPRNKEDAPLNKVSIDINVIKLTKGKLKKMGVHEQIPLRE